MEHVRSQIVIVGSQSQPRILGSTMRRQLSDQQSTVLVGNGARAFFEGNHIGAEESRQGRYTVLVHGPGSSAFFDNNVVVASPTQALPRAISIEELNAQIMNGPQWTLDPGAPAEPAVMVLDGGLAVVGHNEWHGQLAASGEGSTLGFRTEEDAQAVKFATFDGGRAILVSG
jgi:hypothetical protein